MALSARARRKKRLEAARGYLMLGMADHALKELNGIDDPEKCPFAVNQLRGEAFQSKEDYTSALKAFRRAYAENPKDVDILLGMAWCYKRTGQLARSISAMEEAYHSDPEQPIVLYNMSCYFALAGNKAQSLSWLGRALRMEAGLRKLIDDESDFDSLRDDPDFQLIVGALDNVKEAS
ncbi:MAG: hypothetical protein CMJ48_14180 [Planctomycetaceae bacterium]|nr:hypothetical protein [Planctomycetaceae bacterium]